jgi:hypothetical protein
VRATLHDDLMRDAGFETDYHRELDLRRERRRRARAWAVAHAALFVFLVAGLIQLWADYLPGVPRPVLETALAVIFVYQVGGFLKRHLWPTVEDEI